jgi:hypothetical protein
MSLSALEIMVDRQRGVVAQTLRQIEVFPPGLGGDGRRGRVVVVAARDPQRRQSLLTGRSMASSDGR